MMIKKKIGYLLLNILIWLLQFGLAIPFLIIGFLKITKPVSELAYMIPWVNDFPTTMVRFIGIFELLGGTGLILPSLLRIKPILTPLSAMGIHILMILAFFYHLSKNEIHALILNAIIALLALCIVLLRHRILPIEAKK